MAKVAKKPSSTVGRGQVSSQIFALSNYKALAIPWVESEGDG